MGIFKEEVPFKECQVPPSHVRPSDLNGSFLFLLEISTRPRILFSKSQRATQQTAVQGFPFRRLDPLFFAASQNQTERTCSVCDLILCCSHFSSCLLLYNLVTFRTLKMAQLTMMHSTFKQIYLQAFEHLEMVRSKAKKPCSRILAYICPSLFPRKIARYACARSCSLPRSVL